MTESDDEPDSDAGDPNAGELEDEYRMESGERPEHIRRRNRITGILLLLLIAVFVGISIYSRAA